MPPSQKFVGRLIALCVVIVLMLSRVAGAQQEAAGPGPLDVPAVMQQGYEALEQEDYDQAIQLLNEYIVQKPKDEEAYLHLGNAYFEKEMLDSAILQYKKALELKSKYWQALYRLGYAYYGQGKYEEADKTFRKGVKIKERGEFYNGLGLVLRALAALQKHDIIHGKKSGVHRQAPIV